MPALAQVDPPGQLGHPIRVGCEQFGQRRVGQQAEVVPGVGSRVFHYEILSYMRTVRLGDRAMNGNRESGLARDGGRLTVCPPKVTLRQRKVTLRRAKVTENAD